MLRRRLSAGALRQLHSQANAARSGPAVTPASKQARATITPGQSTTTQSKSLASGVLLGTQRNWKGENVATLKAELKRRNLSQQGNKSTLIARLTSAETSALLPPVPPVSKAAPPRARPVSTTTAAAAPVATKPVSSPAPSTPRAVPEAAKVGNVLSTAGDSDVESTPTLVEPAEVPQEVRTSAPGIPIKPGTIPSKALDIKFPQPRPDAEVDQTIPGLPQDFTIRAKPAQPSTQSTGPTVVTVASASTHPAGGPVSPSSEVSDSHALEYDPRPDEAALFNREMESGAIAADDTLTALKMQFPDIKMPDIQNIDEVVYQPSSRPLNDEERSGAYLLVSGLVTVVAVGWMIENSKSKKRAAAKEAHAHGDAAAAAPAKKEEKH